MLNTGHISSSEFPKVTVGNPANRKIKKSAEEAINSPFTMKQIGSSGAVTPELIITFSVVVPPRRETLFKKRLAMSTSEAFGRADAGTLIGHPHSWTRSRLVDSLPHVASIRFAYLRFSRVALVDENAVSESH